MNSLWTPNDDALMSAEAYDDMRTWISETLAEVGNEYFIELRDSCDANFMASQYANGKLYRRFGNRTFDEVERFYAGLYGSREVL